MSVERLEQTEQHSDVRPRMTHLSSACDQFELTALVALNYRGTPGPPPSGSPPLGLRPYTYSRRQVRFLKSLYQSHRIEKEFKNPIDRWG